MIQTIDQRLSCLPVCLIELAISFVVVALNKRKCILMIDCFVVMINMPKSPPIAHWCT